MIFENTTNKDSLKQIIAATNSNETTTVHFLTNLNMNKCFIKKINNIKNNIPHLKDNL